MARRPTKTTRQAARERFPVPSATAADIAVVHGFPPPPRGFFTQLPSTELVASLHGALIQTINYGVKPSDLDLLRDECVRRGLL
jgi:hypothetical protein